MALSRSSIKTAGKRLRNDRLRESDIKNINEWRSSHRYVLNNFNDKLDLIIKKYKKSNKPKYPPIKGQRLKRFETIKDKLQNRTDGMCLFRMNDIAGSRVIFDNKKDIYSFIDLLTFNNFREINQEDMVKNPKKTGYKGIHKIYEYTPNRSSSIYRGMRIELQLRTRYHHYWSTAVEMYDIINNSRCKFSSGDSPSDVELYFQYSSELFSRVYDNERGYFSNISDLKLFAYLINLEYKLRIIRQLYNLKSIQNFPKLKKVKGKNLHNVVVKISINKLSVDVYSSHKELDVIKKYEEWEREFPKDMPVYILGASKKEIEECFKNYFIDSKDYTDAMLDALFILLDKSTRNEKLLSKVMIKILKFSFYRLIKPSLDKTVKENLENN